jgi:cell wall-associated NlpC family hydrolase
VAVPVANVWDRSDSARPIDTTMTGSAPSVLAWLGGLDYQGRLGLDSLLATQVLLNDPLVVLGQWGRWAQVRVTGQTGAVWRQGIEGWMPSAQLTFDPPLKTSATATVASPTAIIGNLRLSYGTVLPVLAVSRGALTVAVPGGEATVASSNARTRPVAGSGTAVVAEAERFLGLPYLWAGTSGFGFDCSGLTFEVYRQFGITLPRDAADQAAAGTRVPKEDLKPGDLVFFAFGGLIDHVGIYAGGGKMLDSPQTGGAVELVDMWGTPLSAHFVSAARYR